VPRNAAQKTHTADDRSWFGERVEELLPELYGAAVRLCGDRVDAEDLVADAIVKAWDALASLNDRASFRAWVFRILNNTFVSGCRSAAARAVHEPIDTRESADFSLFERLHQPFLLWWGDPELEFLNRLLRDDLEAAMHGLPDAFRAVVVMVDVEGLRYHEAAEALDIPIGTVRSRLARGRSLLQQALWNHALEAGLTEGPAPGAPNVDEG
jgi:RNA polymerase sigma-70 factor (ECF subfamily)